MKITNALLTIGATFAVAASAAPSHRGPPAEILSKNLIKKLSIKGLTRHTDKFQSFADLNGGTRVFGSNGHNATLQYFVDQTKKYYDVTVQPTHLPYTETVSETATIVSPLPDGNVTLAPILMSSTPSTPEEGVTADAAIVPNIGCDIADYANVQGKIAIVSRGTCTFGQKSSLAAQAGAVGALIYNNEDGDLNGTLGNDYEDKVPTAGISSAEGQRLIELASTGTLTLKLVFIELSELRGTANVCAQTKTGNKHNVVVLGAHSDSVLAGPGINDNGSGSAALLEIAHIFRNVKPNNAVRFCWWTGEEFGLLGAEHYVASLTESELADISLYLNFDMIASVNYVNAIYDGDGDAFGVAGPPGSAAIEKLFVDFFAKHHGYSDPTEFDGRSDYGPFIEVGIPSGGTFTGAEGIKTEEQAKRYGGTAGNAYDECYHAKCDTTENLNHEAFLLHAKSIAHAVATYSTSTESVDVQRNLTANSRVLAAALPAAAGSPAKTTIGTCSGSKTVYAI